jgi:hypothetical protein
LPVPLAARSKASVCGRSLSGIAGSNPSGDMDVCMSLVIVVCCLVEISAKGGSLLQNSPTDCVCVCDHRCKNE